MTSQVPTEGPPRVQGQTYWDKGWQKCKEQPFVPIGVVATTIALLGASQSFRTGNKAQFNRFLRFRVLAQGLTIAGCVIGSFVYTKEAAEQKAIKRQEELEKIRVAGSNFPGENTAALPSAPPPASPFPPPEPVSPRGPATTEELWRRWGVKSDGPGKS